MISNYTKTTKLIKKITKASMAGTLKNETKINNIRVNNIATQEILFEIFGRIKSTSEDANIAIAAKPIAIIPLETRDVFLFAKIKA